MDKIINGSLISSQIKDEIKVKVDKLVNENKKRPTLAVIIVGDDKASHVYVNAKEKASSYVGFESRIVRLANDISQEKLIEEITYLNKDIEVDGILVQLPLPKHLDEKIVINNIDVNKDVDGLSLLNIGRLHANEQGMIPCTPKGIMRMLEYINYDLTGKNAVVIGRSKLVGGPIAKLLSDKNATVTICHSKTKDLKAECKKADILVVAIGKPKFITKEYVKKDAVIIDVGINRLEDGLVGDVDYNNVIDEVSYITPVPKGVGPMTISMLLENTFEAYNNSRGERND